HVSVADVVEVPESQDLPFQSDRAQKGRTCDVVVVRGDVIDLECAARGISQQHVAGIAIVETAESDKTPIGSNLAQPVCGQDAVVAEVVNLVLPVPRL